MVNQSSPAMNEQNPYQALAKSVASHPQVSGDGQIVKAMEGLWSIIEWESKPSGTKLESVRQQLSVAERSVADPILVVAVNMLLCAVVHYAGQGEWNLSAEQVQQVEHVDRAVMKSVPESTRFVKGADVARTLDDWAETLKDGMGQSGGIDDRDIRLATWLVERLNSCRELVQMLPVSDEKLRAVLDCVARPPRRAIHAAGVAPATLHWQRELVLLDMKIERLIVGWLADHRVALIAPADNIDPYDPDRHQAGDLQPAIEVQFAGRVKFLNKCGWERDGQVRQKANVSAYGPDSAQGAEPPPEAIQSGGLLLSEDR